MSSPTSLRRTIRAFTLIELLTVIAIIGVLAAILIPTVGKVRATARNAQCVSRLRDWGVAINLYANDNKGKYRISNWMSGASNPYQPYFPGSSSQMTTIRSFSGCPLLNQTLADASMCYSMILPSIKGNIATLLANDADGTMNVPLNRAVSPSKFLMLCDSMIGGSPRMNANQLDEYVGPLFGKPIINPATRGDETVARRHGGTKINGVFGDGGVRSITGSAVGSGDSRSIYEMRTTWFQLN